MIKRDTTDFGGFGRPVTNWCNPFTGPPLLDLIYTIDLDWWIKNRPPPNYKNFIRRSILNETIIKCC